MIHLHALLVTMALRILNHSTSRPHGRPDSDETVAPVPLAHGGRRPPGKPLWPTPRRVAAAARLKRGPSRVRADAMVGAGGRVTLPG